MRLEVRSTKKIEAVHYEWRIRKVRIRAKWWGNGLGTRSKRGYFVHSLVIVLTTWFTGRY
jgi:hypothetical protein